MRLPEELRDADLVLTRYGRWAEWRPRLQRCGSAEGRYQAPKWETEQQEPMIADHTAMDVQRQLNLIPLQYRRVLTAHYVRHRWPVQRWRREMHISRTLWDATLLQGLRMFSDLWVQQNAKAMRRIRRGQA